MTRMAENREGGLLPLTINCYDRRWSVVGNFMSTVIITTLI